MPIDWCRAAWLPPHILARRGVVTSVATNNVLNPFTPYGDASLIRMANLYANVAQLSRREDIEAVFDMVAGSAARLMGIDPGFGIGAPADIVLLDCEDRDGAVRQVSRVIRGWKRGRQSFENGQPRVLRPHAGAEATRRA